MVDAPAAPPRAMILAAGLGTRLRPLTDELPKPLVPIGDRPALAHIAARLAAAGVREAVINTHHLAGAFTEARLAALPIQLTKVHEPRILGTAGGLANAAPLLGDGDVIVWNGDILAAIDVGALVEAHRGRGDLATLAVAPRARGEGTVGLDARGGVCRLRGERFGEEASGGDFVGIQVVRATLVRALPAEGCLVGDGYLPALRQGARIGAWQFTGCWGDVGALSAYLEENLAWLREAGRPFHVGAGARVAAAVALDASVIGEGAVVTGAGVVRRAVVWPGARAVAPLEGVVVTASGAVVNVDEPTQRAARPPPGPCQSQRQ